MPVSHSQVEQRLKVPASLCAPFLWLPDGSACSAIGHVIEYAPPLDCQHALMLLFGAALPPVAPVPLWTYDRAGQQTSVTATLRQAGPVRLSKADYDRVARFHLRFWSLVTKNIMRGGSPVFAPEEAVFLIVPLLHGGGSGGDRGRALAVDWATVDAALDDFGFASRAMSPEDLAGDTLGELLLTTRYNGQIFRPLRVRWDLCPLSPMSASLTFAEYFKGKPATQNIALRADQPLVEAVPVSALSYNALRARTRTSKRSVVHLVPQLCYVHWFSAEFLLQTRTTASFIWRLHQTLLVSELAGAIGLPVDRCLLWAALTTNAAHEAFSSERMELLGDSFLKLAVVSWCYLTRPHWGENRISRHVSQVLCNAYLANVGARLGLHKYVMAKPFRAPWFEAAGLPPLDLHESVRTRQLSLKQMADATEALVGAYLLSGGFANALALLQRLELPFKIAEVFVIPPLSSEQVNANARVRDVLRVSRPPRSWWPRTSGLLVHRRRFRRSRLHWATSLSTKHF